MSHLKRAISLAMFISVMCLFSLSAWAQSIANEFETNDDVSVGNIVSLDSADKKISLTDATNLNQMYGVIVENGDITFHSGDSNDKALVAKNEVVHTLVSTIAGEIKKGDPITVGKIAGVGEKARRAGRIIGFAIQPLNKKSPNARTISIDNNGDPVEVIVAKIEVKVSASDYTPSNSKINEEDEENRNALQRIADNVAGKEVKPVALIISGLILLIASFVSIFLITSSSYSSMISIGRNPMAKSKIIRSLLGLLVIAVVIFLVGVGLSYLALLVLS